jgi:hypothetical protein
VSRLGAIRGIASAWPPMVFHYGHRYGVADGWNSQVGRRGPVGAENLPRVGETGTIEG